MVATTVVIGVWVGGPAAILLACLVAFAFFNAISGDLTGVYPAEIFPSELRGSGVGFSAAMSRIGAAAGTFLLPVGIDRFGIGPSMLIAAAVCAVGLVVTYLWAPETTELSLTQTQRATPPGSGDD
jgi:putative MFS transporter